MKTLIKAKEPIADAIDPVSQDHCIGQTIKNNPKEKQAEIATPELKANRPRIENPQTKYRQPFTVRPFINRRTGSQSWRVMGSKRDGTRVRENFTELNSAQCRQVELTTEWLVRQTETAVRATKLTETQVKLAEAAFLRLQTDQELMLAIEHWLKHGRQYAVAESPRLDDAIEQFKAWLDGAKNPSGTGGCTLREISRYGLRNIVGIFGNSIPNMRVDQITDEIVEAFLAKLKVSPVTRDNYKRSISRFFSWCIERPRRWTAVNPCREIRIDKGERQPPIILNLTQCEALLRAAEREGIAPYVAVCLFGGLRPFEAARLTWQAVNLEDREIRLEGFQTKTGRPRVVTVCNTLHKWLTVYQGQPFFPSNWRTAFDTVKQAAGFGTPTADSKLTPWIPDVMRHVAASHFFRLTSSYGQTAEQFGNSEAIIKKHYQGRVSSKDMEKFYALLPSKHKTLTI